MPTLEELFRLREVNPLGKGYEQTLQDLSRQTYFPATRSEEAAGPQISAKPKEGWKETGERLFDWLDEMGEKYDIGPKLESMPIAGGVGALLSGGNPIGGLIGAAMPWVADTRLGEELEKNVPPADLPGMAVLSGMGAGKAAKAASRRGFLGTLMGGAVGGVETPKRLMKNLEGVAKIAEGGKPEAISLLQEIVNVGRRDSPDRIVNTIKNGVAFMTKKTWTYKPNGQSGYVDTPILRDVQGIGEELMGYGQMRSDRYIRMLDRLDKKGVLTEKPLQQAVSELYQHEITEPSQLAYDLKNADYEIAPAWVEKAFPGFSKYYRAFRDADPDALSEFLERVPYKSLKKWEGSSEVTKFREGLTKAEEQMWQRREQTAKNFEADTKALEKHRQERRELKNQIEEARYQRGRRGEATSTPGTELQRLPLQLPSSNRPYQAAWNQTKHLIDTWRKEDPIAIYESQYFKGSSVDEDRGYARYLDKRFTDLPKDLQEFWIKQRALDQETGEVLNVLEDGVRGSHVFNVKESAFQESFNPSQGGQLMRWMMPPAGAVLTQLYQQQLDQQRQQRE